MQQTPAPAAPAAPVVAPEAPTAAQMLDAQKAMRNELDRQLDQQQELREDITDELQQTSAGSPERAGLEARLKVVDTRIADLDQQLAEANARVAQASAVLGAIVPPPPRPIIQRSGPPEEVFILGSVFVIFVLMPLAVGFARRLWKRSATAVMEMPREMAERFTRLEQAVDAVAVELERVGEGQRFVTNLFAEQGQRALGGGAADPLAVRQREPVGQARP
jgi:hypothetical protein